VRDCRASPFAMLRASAHRNDDSVEGEEIASSLALLAMTSGVKGEDSSGRVVG